MGSVDFRPATVGDTGELRAVSVVAYDVMDRAKQRNLRRLKGFPTPELRSSTD